MAKKSKPGKVAKRSGKATGKASRKSTQAPSAKRPKKKPVKKTSHRRPPVGTTGSAPKTSRSAGRKARAKSPLSKSQIKEFQEMLLEKRHSLIGDMTGMEAEALRAKREEGSDLSLVPDHPANIATDNYEQEFTLGLLESERTMLAEIDEALQRIEDDMYGVCLGTGEPIAKARLRARPWAKYSIEYARLIEKGLVRPSDRNVEEEEAEKKDSQNRDEGSPGDAEEPEGVSGIEDEE